MSSNLTASKYRISYEAFSKLSARLTKAGNVEDLAQVFSENLKYLFNFKLFRVYVQYATDNVALTFYGDDFFIEKENPEMMDYEIQLCEDHIPVLEEKFFHEYAKYTRKKAIQDAKRWGWYFEYSDISVCTSLVAANEAPFSYGDVEILHLLVDSLSTKYKQILLSISLQKNNEYLKKAFKEIENKNDEIKLINDHQQEIIYQRTKELRLKNERLLELSRVNAHNLREPLSRILGLLQISDCFSVTELKSQLLDKIKISALELDDTLKDVVEKSSQNLEDIA